MFKKVLLAVDGSESAKHAATTALKLGLLRGAELVLVTAFDVARATYGGLISLSREQSDSLHASLRNRVLEPARSALASAGATSRGLMVEGHPVVALADEARRQQADLIVVARRGLGTVERFFTGSVSASLARESPVPLLLVPASEGTYSPTERLRRAVLPTDFSEESQAGLRAGIEICRELQAEAFVTHSIAGWDVFPGGNPDLPFFNESLQELYSELRQRLDREIQELCPESVRARALLVDGDPAEGVLKAVADTHAQLLVLSSHGRTGLNRLLMGSTAEKLIQKSPAPVLLWRRAKA